MSLSAKLWHFVGQRASAVISWTPGWIHFFLLALCLVCALHDRSMLSDSLAASLKEVEDLKQECFNCRNPPNVIDEIMEMQEQYYFRTIFDIGHVFDDKLKNWGKKLEDSIQARAREHNNKNLTESRTSSLSSIKLSASSESSGQKAS